MPAVEGEALVHRVRTEPAVELNRRAFCDESGEIISLAGLFRDPFAPEAQIDDPLRPSKPLLHSPHRFVLPD